MPENSPGEYRPSKVSAEAITAAAGRAENMRQLLQLLGLAAYGGNYEVMRRRLTVMGLMSPAFQAQRRGDRLSAVSRDELERAASRSDGFAGMLRHLDIPWTAGAHRRIKEATSRLAVDTSHFLGQAHNRGQKLRGRGTPLEQVLVAGRHTQTNALKRRLLEAGFLDPYCAMCGRSEWNGAAIPLELDHVNGDRLDNRLQNLRLLCPNCHAQTPTYRGRNIGKQREPVPVASQELPDLARDAASRLRSLLPRRA